MQMAVVSAGRGRACVRAWCWEGAVEGEGEDEGEDARVDKGW